MIRRALRGGLWLGLLVGLVFVVARLLRTRTTPATIDLRGPVDSSGSPRDAWAPLQTSQTPETPSAPAAPAETAPADTAPAEPAAKPTLPPWVAPDDGICPQTHPVKAKLSSGIFQVEGNAMYERTRPDRCYESPEAAAADGLRPAKH